MNDLDLYYYLNYTLKSTFSSFCKECFKLALHTYLEASIIEKLGLIRQYLLLQTIWIIWLKFQNWLILYELSTSLINDLAANLPMIKMGIFAISLILI